MIMLYIFRNQYDPPSPQDFFRQTQYFLFWYEVFMSCSMISLVKLTLNGNKSHDYSM